MWVIRYYNTFLDIPLKCVPEMWIAAISYSQGLDLNKSLSKTYFSINQLFFKPTFNSNNKVINST